MGEAKLTSPRVLIVREGQPELELQTTNADLVAWDLARAKQRPVWPTFQDAPFLWLTFIGWAAARRTGAIETTYTFETWRDEVLEVTTVDDDEDTEAGSPFPTGEQGEAYL